MKIPLFTLQKKFKIKIYRENESVKHHDNYGYSFIRINFYPHKKAPVNLITDAHYII